MVSAQERLTRTFTRSSHTYTRTERTEISKTRGGETKREVRVEESTQVGGDPFPAVFGDFLGRERLGSFGSMTRQQEGEQGWAGLFTGRLGLLSLGAGWGRCSQPDRAGLSIRGDFSEEGGQGQGQQQPQCPPDNPRHSLQVRPALRT